MSTGLLDEARRVADVTLFEGYVLYPYRASARKNQMRWQFGVLTPPSYAAAGTGEHDSCQTECLLDPREDTVVHLQVRFLQAQQRAVERAERTGFVATDQLSLTDRVLVPWDEGVLREVDLVVPLEQLTGAGVSHAFAMPGGEDVEAVEEDGRLLGRLVRRRAEVRGLLSATTEPVDGPYGALRLCVVLSNTTPFEADGAARDRALRHSLVAAHTLVGLEGGSFISLLDPPEWARPAAAACSNLHTWPVLVGPEERPAVVLSSPIILYDHPQLAPESPGELYDATEIDEILSLRTLALTDEEKREARGTDPRAAQVIDRVDSMPAEVLERLHGAVRAMRHISAGVPPPAAPAAPPDHPPWWDPGADESVSPETDSIEVAGRAVAKGARVRLCPSRRGTDAQDIFLEGRTATVEAVLHDVDGGSHLAVTLDDDPGADLQRAHGRFLYFRPDEIEPLDERPLEVDRRIGADR